MTAPFSLQFSGELGLRGIEALKAELVAALAGHESIAIDAIGVESADTSAIQLLLAAQKTASAEGKVLTLSTRAGGPFARSLVALGLVAADGAPLVPETSTWTFKAPA